MAGGYLGRILRVNLTTGQLRDEDLPSEEVLRRLPGGKGLGLYYLARLTKPSLGATDEAAPLIFMTGPLTGTIAPSSSDYVVVTLHYDVPYSAGLGHSHGYWGPYLKMAGYDGIIVTGISPTPVYLMLRDGKAELRDAAHVWGKDTRETDRLLRAELGQPPQTSIACIGPAGEAMLHGAAVKNDCNHGAHKGSGGAVMGSKRLKAIAVTAGQAIPLARPGEFMHNAEEWESSIDYTPKSHVWARAMHNGGMIRVYSRASDAILGVMPIAFKNLMDPGAAIALGKSFVADVPKWMIEPQPSFNCSIACAYNARISTGPFAGSIVRLDGGGENLEGAGAMIGVTDAGTCAMLADFYDAMGTDSAATGAVVAAAFEMYNRGLITKGQTDGLDLSWGNYESAITLVEKMCRREGVGAILNQGLKEAVCALHPDGERYLVHVKNAGFNTHDWRPAWDTLLGQFVAGSGPCWQGLGRAQPEPDLGWTMDKVHIPCLAEGAPEAVHVSQIKKMFEDCLGVCWFACLTVPGSTSLAPKALALATGWSDFDDDEAKVVGERVINLMRLFYVSRGFKKADEFDIGPRLLEAPPSGPGAGNTIAPFVEGMVDRYYELLGWDKATGAPTREVIERFGLPQDVPDLVAAALPVAPVAQGSMHGGRLG